MKPIIPFDPPATIRNKAKRRRAVRDYERGIQIGLEERRLQPNQDRPMKGALARGIADGLKMREKG